MPTCFAALMCHAPIVVPAVGGEEASRCARTTRAMREVASRAVASRPERLVLISPHTPRHERAWGVCAAPLKGDLGGFRAPGVRVDLPVATDVASAVGAEPLRSRPLDHGAMVPLAFLWEAGWRGPTAVLALPMDGSGGDVVGRALSGLPGRTAVIASGDMSHRLIPGAPAGYHPEARRFDAAFTAALAKDRWPEALTAEPRALAAEDVVDSTAVAMAAAGGPLNAELLSYEGPWGVGYTEAILYDPQPPLYAIARAAIRARLEGRKAPVPSGGPASGGVFVTLHLDGELRGCVGHLAATRERLYEEVADVARASAFEDPRFPPLEAPELPDLRIETSLLEPPEPVADTSTLDPTRWGIVVSAGRRRGVLLPDIEGVDTVEQQIAICRRKAGIGRDEPIRIERFSVRKEASP